MNFKAALTAIAFLALTPAAWAQSYSPQQSAPDLPEIILTGIARFIAIVPWWIWVLLIIAVPVGLWIQREDQIRKRMHEQRIDEAARRRREKRGY